MIVRKHNARRITEVFEYETLRMEDSTKIEEDLKAKGSAVVGKSKLAGFEIAGERGKVFITFDERDKQQVIDLLRIMTDQLAGEES